MEQTINTANLYSSPENERFAVLLSGGLDYSLELADAHAKNNFEYWDEAPRLKIVTNDDGEISDVTFRTQTIVSNDHQNVTLNRIEKSIATGEDTTSTITVVNRGSTAREFMAYSTTSRPADVLQQFAAKAKNLEQAGSLLDEILSPRLSDYVEKSYSRIEHTVGHAIGRLMISAEDETDVESMQLELLIESASDDASRAETARKVIGSANHTIMKRLDEGSVSLDKATRLLEPFILADALGDNIVDIKLFGHAAQSPVNEIMLQWLIAHPNEVTQKEQLTNMQLAKKHIKDVLNLYEQDPQRHQGNIAIIKEQLFPDAKRIDSLSRDTLVGLSNGIIKSQNATLAPEDQFMLLDKTKNASVGEAFRRLLAITTANSANSDIAAKQRVEDALHSDIISLLFEPQSVKAVQEKQPQRAQHIGSQAVRAYSRSRERPNKLVNRHKLRKPGYGHVS